MISKLTSSHNRIMKLWTETDKLWKETNDDKRVQLIQFLSAMLASLSSKVTDVEWDEALKVGADSLKLWTERTKGDSDNAETETTGQS